MPPPMSEPERAVRRLLEIMDKLRDPGGCPWDREQTLRTLTPYLLEEAHEVIEAIEAGDVTHHKEELGDLLFQVVFQSRIAREEGKFDFAQVCDAISDKLTRRHPHVFGDVAVSGSREVVKNWERIKADERKQKGESPRSAIGGVSVSLPALVRAERLTEKAGPLRPDLQIFLVDLPHTAATTSRRTHRGWVRGGAGPISRAGSRACVRLGPQRRVHEGRTHPGPAAGPDRGRPQWAPVDCRCRFR